MCWYSRRRGRSDLLDPRPDLCCRGPLIWCHVAGKRHRYDVAHRQCWPARSCGLPKTNQSAFGKSMGRRFTTKSQENLLQPAAKTPRKARHGWRRVGYVWGGRIGPLGLVTLILRQRLNRLPIVLDCDQEHRDTPSQLAPVSDTNSPRTTVGWTGLVHSHSAPTSSHSFISSLGYTGLSLVSKHPFSSFIPCTSLPCWAMHHTYLCFRDSRKSLSTRPLCVLCLLCLLCHHRFGQRDSAASIHCQFQRPAAAIQCSIVIA